MEDLIAKIVESSSSSVGGQDVRAMRGDRFVAIYVLCNIGFRVWNDNILAVSLGGGLGSVLCQTQVQGGYRKNLADDPDAGLLGKRTSTRSFVWSTSVGATTYRRTLVS
ncbi:hypothetical protein V8C34DRAFT_152565 [Trichoderma compactum]